MSDQALILVVEDNDFVRMQIVSFLKAAAYQAVEAASGDEAVTLMAGNPAIALAIVDVKMAPMGGFEFLKAVRGRDIHTPVVLVTGDETGDLLEQASKLGVSAVLMKPVDRERLVKTVERTLKNKRHAR